MRGRSRLAKRDSVFRVLGGEGVIFIIYFGINNLLFIGCDYVKWGILGGEAERGGVSLE